MKSCLRWFIQGIVVEDDGDRQLLCAAGMCFISAGFLILYAMYSLVAGTSDTGYELLAVSGVLMVFGAISLIALHPGFSRETDAEEIDDEASTPTTSE